MNENGVAQRRNWFRAFPEGSIEFVIVTRVLALLLVLSMGIVRDTQRPEALLVLAFVLWVDYLLTLWWAVQLATDLDALSCEPPPSAEVLRRRRVQSDFVASIPVTTILLMLAPWPDYLPISESAVASLTRIARPALALAFVISLWPAYRALQRIRLGSPRWTLLLLVPLVHWVALHRLVIEFHGRLREREREQGMGTDDDGGPRTAAVAADVLWVLSVLPWGVLLLVALLRGGWPKEASSSIVPVCGTLLAAVFAVLDVAAVENVHRRFVALIRRSERSTAPQKDPTG